MRLFILACFTEVWKDAEHNRYAPFQIRELKEKQFDYWALGHIHKREILLEEPYIVYPGNIQGRHRKEIGEKGAYLIELTKQGTQCSFSIRQMLCGMR